MAKKAKAICLPGIKKASPKVPVIGVFSPCDPRIDEASTARHQGYRVGPPPLGPDGTHEGGGVHRAERLGGGLQPGLAQGD